jgi:hypothetical protein
MKSVRKEIKGFHKTAYLLQCKNKRKKHTYISCEGNIV